MVISQMILNQCKLINCYSISIYNNQVWRLLFQKNRKSSSSSSPLSSKLSLPSNEMIDQITTTVDVNSLLKSIESEDKMKEIVSNWINKWVIKHKLCPWAYHVNNKKLMNIIVINRNINTILNKRYVLNQIVKEALNIINKNNTIETSIIILPKMKNFNVFLNFINDIEFHFLKDNNNNIHENIQIASFHPNFQFKNTLSSNDDVTNYTNISPYPIIHLLYRPKVTIAIESTIDGNTEYIWQNNIKRMNDLGLDQVIEIRNNIINEVINNIFYKNDDDDNNSINDDIKNAPNIDDNIDNK